MKTFTIPLLLTLATAVLATPANELEKRATCTAFGFPYYCASTSAAAVTTTTRVAATTTSRAPGATTTAPSTGGGNTGASRYTTGSTANDITANTGCTDVTVIFARGTSEGGNIGSIAGPPMFKQLLADLGASKLTLQGVDYPADSAGNANCGAAGGPDMANKANTILARCPNTKIVLSGYSQGACVVHNTVEKQGFPAAKVAAAVLFGDPFNGQPLGSVPANRVREICASGDTICSRGGSGSGSGSGHLSYGGDAKQAASFIETTTGA